MDGYFRLFKSEFLKMKHTSFYWIHLLIPVIGSAVFLGYYAITGFGAITKVQVYIEAIAIAFPVLSAVLTSFAVDQEAMAGGFKEMISGSYKKSTAFMSKLSFLFLGGICSGISAVFLFYLGFHFLLKQNPFDFKFYMVVSIILIVCQFIIYLVHLVVSLRFGKGAVIGLAFFETLLIPLMLTGLGEGIWMFIPCAWAARLCDYYLLYWRNGETVIFESFPAIAGMAAAVLMIFAAAVFWFERFEGKKN